MSEEAKTETVEATRVPTDNIRWVPERGYDITNATEMTWFMKQAKIAGILPRGCETLAQALMLAQAGRDFGMNLTETLAYVAVINGRAMIHSNGVPAQLFKNGIYDVNVYIEGDGDDRAGICEIQRTPTSPKRRAIFSLAEAKQAGLYPGKGGPWSLYTNTMLMRHALRLCAGLFAADKLHGAAVSVGDETDKLIARSDDAQQSLADAKASLVAEALSLPS